MKAAVVTSFGEPPRYDDIDRPEPADGEIVVDMIASALSPRVRSGANGTHYSSDGALPMVPGIDGVGRTADGTLVYVLALDAPMGTMAEQVVVPSEQVIELPAGLDPVAAAAAAVPGMSSWASLTSRVRMEPGQEVLILGATGTAGRMAVQIAKHLGAGRVVAAGRDPERLAALTAVGADDLVPLTDGPFDPTLAADVDIVLDFVWGSVTERALPAMIRARRSTAPLTWVEIGSMAGADVTLPSAALRAADLRIIGTGQGASGPGELLQHVAGLMTAVAAGAVDVAAHAVPLADVEKAWDAPVPGNRRTVFTWGR
jgi:NADPH:quinone reductase-like Zn-dependent oxidoreductase